MGRQNANDVALHPSMPEHNAPMASSTDATLASGARRTASSPHAPTFLPGVLRSATSGKLQVVAMGVGDGSLPLPARTCGLHDRVVYRRDPAFDPREIR